MARVKESGVRSLLCQAASADTALLQLLLEDKRHVKTEETGREESGGLAAGCVTGRHGCLVGELAVCYWLQPLPSLFTSEKECGFGSLSGFLPELPDTY